MSSVTGTSSISSIYGNRNVISGLASGMDTESMIENAVSGIKLKISALGQKQTKIQWQQEAYRSIIDKMVDFNKKYFSYASSTNLFSASFFNSAIKAAAQGTYADKISATGKTSSDVQILGVKQLATAASYRTSGGHLSSVEEKGDKLSISGDRINLKEKLELSNVSGTLTLSYGGGRTINLEFDDFDNYHSAEEFKAGIVEKLKGVTVSNSSGEMVGADTMIQVDVDASGNIKFSDKQNAGNTVAVTGASGKIKDTLGIEPSDKSDTLSVAGKDLVNEDSRVGDYLSGKEISVTLDGVTKKITLPTYRNEKGNTLTAEQFRGQLQDALDDAFGEGKITVGNGDTSGGRDALKLEFQVQKGSTLSISSTAGEALGFGGDQLTTYLDTGKTLGELGILEGLTPTGNKLKGTGAIEKQEDGTYLDSAGKLVDEDGYRIKVDENGNALKDEDGNYLYMDTYELKINGVTIGEYSEETALETVMVGINNNTEAGVNVSYSKLTNQFQFTAQNTGEAGKIEMGEGLAQKLFGDSEGQVTDGQDAVLTMKVNGETMEVERSNNTFDIDGMNVTLKGAFNYGEDGRLVEGAENDAVSFTFSSDADKIVDAVKSMVEDYNAMVTEIKNAYSTMPAEKSNGSRYEPLTDEDREDMSETAIENYEEKAKQGILFMDRDLSALYDKLRSAITPSGNDGGFLRSIGIGTSYDDGLTTLTLDEEKLRTALSNDPDAVKDAFTKTRENGASTDGLMQSLKTTLDAYAKTTGESILVSKAGSPRVPSSINQNTLQKQLDELNDQIEKWETKLSDKVDYYTSKFTQLEQLILQMNSQSSTLAGLMGGGSY